MIGIVYPEGNRETCSARLSHQHADRAEKLYSADLHNRPNIVNMIRFMQTV